MLQQTQVDRVVPAWSSFLDRFPTREALAAATLADVLRQWGTLGYPRRARDLWRASRSINALPATEDGLRQLPGVGPYTAAAVAAFGHGAGAALPLDTNVLRVVRRYRFPAAARPPRGAVEAAARRFLPGPEVWHALMDVGALLCRARTAACPRCPLASGCASAGAAPPPGLTWARGQAPFHGSRRQARGALLARLRAGPVPVAEADAAALATLVADGLAVVAGDAVTLPQHASAAG